MIQREVIGLVPMAGRATRLARMPCSKEIYPVALSQGDAGTHPKVVSHFLLERLRLAGIRKAYLVIREGKWDIPAYYNDGTALLDLNLAYVMARLPYGPPFSLDAAYPFVREAIVAMGFPDNLFEPHDAFVQLLARQAVTLADLVLGLFRLPEPFVNDMVEVDDTGRVRRYFIKQRAPHLQYTWIVAVWTPRFTEFQHDYLRDYLQTHDAPQQEFFMAHVLHAAVESGMSVQTVAFPQGRFLDIGTPTAMMQLPAFVNSLSLPIPQ